MWLVVPVYVCDRVGLFVAAVLRLYYSINKPDLFFGYRYCVGIVRMIVIDYRLVDSLRTSSPFFLNSSAKLNTCT